MLYRRFRVRGLVLIFFSLGLLLSCTSFFKKEYYFNEIIIQNNSAELIRNVLIKVEKTGRIFKCSIIAPHGECSNKFKQKKYYGNLATISWSNRNYLKFTKNIQLSVPKSFSNNNPIKGIIKINIGGNINAYLAQD